MALIGTNGGLLDLNIGGDVAFVGESNIIFCGDVAFEGDRRILVPETALLMGD